MYLIFCHLYVLFQILSPRQLGTDYEWFTDFLYHFCTKSDFKKVGFRFYLLFFIQIYTSHHQVINQDN